MDWLAVQTMVLGQPEGDEEGWMQLLVFIVLAVFWAIGGIMKARAAKSQQDKKKQQTKERPRPQPRPRPSLERFLQREPQKPRMKPMQPRAVKAARQIARERAAERAASRPMPAKYETVPPERLKIEAVEESPVEKAGALAPVEWTGVEIGTSEQLRAAMLHFEIFGKCVGLRESQEHVWMR